MKSQILVKVSVNSRKLNGNREKVETFLGRNRQFHRHLNSLITSIALSQQLYIKLSYEFIGYWRHYRHIYSAIFHDQHHVRLNTSERHKIKSANPTTVSLIDHRSRLITTLIQ